MILTRLDVNSLEWQRSGACDGQPELFDVLVTPPVGVKPEAKERMVRAARAVCLPCPVRAECLRWAMSTGQNKGMWGGLTQQERVALRKRAKKAEEAREQRLRETEGEKHGE